MQKQKGFTIIELIVVIAIISVLSAIVLVNVNGYRAKARDAKRIADIKQVITALTIYYANNGSYPDGDYDGYGTWDVGNQSYSFLTGKLPGVMNSPPVDPLYTDNSSGYLYYRYPAGTAGCDSNKGAYYVIAIKGFEKVSGTYPGSPGWNCGVGNRDWQGENGMQWVTGAFERP